MTDWDFAWEKVRRRPSLYIGGTDERALHTLPAEILNNAFAEAVTGHADAIQITLKDDGSLVVADNGRGIPVDLHLKFPGKSAVEIIFTLLSYDRLAEREIYQPADALITVTASVVNALSDWLWVEVVRNKTLYRQTFSLGKPTSGLKNEGPVSNRKGTTVCFHPDPDIFGSKCAFKPSILYELAQSRARLYGGVEIQWTCEQGVADGKTPIKENFHFPNGFTESRT